MLTERLRPHGAPIAMTKSPSVRVADWPRVAWGRGLAPAGSSSFSRATSVSLSEPRTLALYACPSYKRHRTSVALSTTCQFESTSPSALMRTPLPEVSWLRFSPRCRSSVRHLMNTTAGNTRSFPFFTTSRKSGPSSDLPAPPWAPARGRKESPAAISRSAPQQDRIMRPPCGRTPKFQARSLAWGPPRAPPPPRHACALTPVSGRTEPGPSRGPRPSPPSIPPAWPMIPPRSPPARCPSPGSPGSCRRQTGPSPPRPSRHP